MKEQFTQGDWGFQANDSYIELHAGDKQIGDLAMGQNTCTKEELEANARLFKVAPKMYRLIEKLLNAGEWYTSALEFERDIDGYELASELSNLLAEARGEK